jgi:hypothetical protein
MTRDLNLASFNFRRQERLPGGIVGKEPAVIFTRVTGLMVTWPR